MPTADGRSYVTGYFQLTLDGEPSGYVKSVEAKDEEISLQMGLAMGQPVKDWIDATLRGSGPRKGGQIKIAGTDGRVEQILEFEGALLTEIDFPALDGSAKSAAHMTLKFSPWIVRNKTGDGSKLEPRPEAAQTMFRPENFRLHIDGLEGASAKVSKVEAIEIKQTVIREAQAGREPVIVPGKIEYPNLKITLSEEYSHDLREGDASQEKTALLEFLDATRQKALISLELKGLRVSRSAGVTAEMYVEKITAKFA